MSIIHINGLGDSGGGGGTTTPDPGGEDLETSLTGNILGWANRQVTNATIGRTATVGTAPTDAPTVDDRNAVYTTLLVDKDGVRRIVVCWLFSDTDVDDRIDNRIYYRAIYNREWASGWLSPVPSLAKGGQTINGHLQINPTVLGGYREGIRVAKVPDNGKSGIYLGLDAVKESGSTDDMWAIETETSEITGSEIKIYCLDSDGNKIGLTGNRNTKTFSINTNLKITGDVNIEGELIVKSAKVTSPPAANISALRNISASTAEASSANCPIGAIYGKYT